MANILFFCIPAHGHTNPTIRVVEALVRRGHRVGYCSFEEFREKIQGAGAEYIPCDGFLPPTPVDLDKKVGKDFASLIEMVVDTTLNMDGMVAGLMAGFRPDVIVSDSVCFWGKLFAYKYKVPFVCSTTTFAFNKHTAKLMKQRPMELLRMLLGMPRIQAKIQALQAGGSPVKDFVSIIQNDNDTNTIVYTSKGFQPMAETFSDKYVFIGPSVPAAAARPQVGEKPRIYISLGTVLHDNIGFYQNCIEALGDLDCRVVISAGKKTDLSKLPNVPPHIEIFPWVNQMEVLANSDVFLTHCGMNSVHESLWQGVPMVLFPQHAEQYAVAVRAEELGAGVRIRSGRAAVIRKAVTQVLQNTSFRAAAQAMQAEFHACGGPEQAADFIEEKSKGIG